jgi:hypothetical protein
MGMTDFLELVKKATPRITVATLRRPRRRQLKPLASPGVRFGVCGGGVEFGESDIGVVKKPGGGGALEVGALPTAVRE